MTSMLAIEAGGIWPRVAMCNRWPSRKTSGSRAGRCDSRPTRKTLRAWTIGMPLTTVLTRSWPTCPEEAGRRRLGGTSGLVRLWASHAKIPTVRPVSARRKVVRIFKHLIGLDERAAPGIMMGANPRYSVARGVPTDEALTSPWGVGIGHPSGNEIPVQVKHRKCTFDTIRLPCISSSDALQ
jgi:hypothetical protein